MHTFALPSPGWGLRLLNRLALGELDCLGSFPAPSAPGPACPEVLPGQDYCGD